ncbi:DUF3373 family protein [Sulfurovum sp. zt1-1]|uniref:DUF3373 family protein n=1 Tax=Sulfurovum zhangzhouensis TaxID=3019067 RepID=A0ABT7R0A4_9BACT|nr:DUF3373 family protein [Sulfurovum zhangzhouensis]MDM5272452.1 DUF3373 family protein [Sulfurovum zhangzhouensis]
MKKILTASLVTAMALTSVNASSINDKINDLETELAKLKKDLKKQNKKINEVKAHDAGDNIKWGVDVRTSIDNINYDMADGREEGKNDLMALRLWLNMEYAADSKNIFKGQLSMNKAFGADMGATGNPLTSPFGMRGTGMDTFDWVTNEALSNGTLKVRQAYWLYLGDDAFGTGMPWTFSVGRRPSTNGFLANLSQDDPALSPLGHVINVEFDGLSSKLDLSGVTGVPGMSFKLCMGQGSTNAAPLFSRMDGAAYANDDAALDDVALAGFIFEPYNDGQYIVKTTAYKAFDVPGFAAGTMVWNPTYMTYMPDPSSMSFVNTGDMLGAAISGLIDGITDDGYFSGVKVFGSFAWSKSEPGVGNDRYFDGGPYDGMTIPVESMLGSMDKESGTSYWFGTYLPVLDGKLGLEYNHGSKYWKPFTQGEDTMIGSKLAARGDAYEVNYTYQLTEALSAQLRYVAIDYDYTGSAGFYGDGGYSMKIDDLKAAAAMGDPTAQAMVPGIVDKAQDIRFYIRYRY